MKANLNLITGSATTNSSGVTVESVYFILFCCFILLCISVFTTTIVKHKYFKLLKHQREMEMKIIKQEILK